MQEMMDHDECTQPTTRRWHAKELEDSSTVKDLKDKTLVVSLSKFAIKLLSPTTNGGMRNGSPVGIHARRVRAFCTFRRRFAFSVGALSAKNFCVGDQEEVY